jgi:hypothetical protein
MVWQLYSVEGISSASFRETPGCSQQKTSTRETMYVQSNNGARTCKHCCSGKAVSITYSECVFVDRIPSMKCTDARLSSVSCPALNNFSTFSHKRHDFREKKVTEIKTCFSIFSTTFVWIIFHSKLNWARYDQKGISVFVYSTRYSCQSLIKPEFLNTFSKSTLMSSIIKTRPVEAELFHTDGRTDMTKLLVAFFYVHGYVHRNNILDPNKMHMSQSLFYLTIALHVLSVTITHLQKQKTTVTTASGNRYTVIELNLLTKSTDRLD